MNHELSRRSVVQMFLLGAAGIVVKQVGAQGHSQMDTTAAASPALPPNRISLAQWSFHRMIQRGELDPLNFPPFAHQSCGVMGVEYVSTFYKSLPLDGKWVEDLKKRATDAGVTSLLIMCDGEGDIGDPDVAARRKAVEAHRRWLDAAAALGCHSIRVNARSVGSPSEQIPLCADGLHQLCALAAPMKLNVIVENHGGLSCDGQWVMSVIRESAATNTGTLPDFGNFKCADGTIADRYAGVKAMIPFARAVSAKSHEFDAAGEETTIDYARMMSILRDARYRGWVGVEFEGNKMGEVAGSIATRELLLKNGCVL